MKQILRILFAACIIAFAASMLAVSCGKTPDAGGGNNNNSGGDGGGNTPTPIPPAIVVTNVNTTVAKVSGNTILLKLSAFPSASITLNNIGPVVNGPASIASGIAKVFEIINDKATTTSEGMLLVGKGSAGNAGEITTSAVATTYPTDDTGDDGIRIVNTATASANGGIPVGLSFMSVFANTNAPTTTAQAAVDAEPFAFSPVSTTTAANFAQPIFWCRATAPAITATVVATDRLTGAHKAECFISSLRFAYGHNLSPRAAWFSQADPFKREIQVAVSAIKTDGKTIANLGLPGATDAAKLGNFTDGISATEMAAIVAANSGSLFRKFNIKIVNDTDFAAGTP